MPIAQNILSQIAIHVNLSRDMVRSSSLLFLLFFCLSTVFAQKNTYTIRIKAENCSNPKVYLMRLNLKTNDKLLMDSTLLKNGRAVFRGSLDTFHLCTILVNDTIKIPFFTEKNVSISLDAKKSVDVKITGGIENQLFKKYEFLFDRKGYDVVLKNPGTAFSAFTTYYILQGEHLTKEEIYKLTGALRGNALKTEYFSRIIPLAEAVVRTLEGTLAPDFEVLGLDGRPITLSSLRGKYVVLEFWTSWCGPCRKNNPKWQALYEKYKGDNVEIFGVSFDWARQCEAWKQAVKKDGITYLQGSNCDGWNDISGLYAVKSVPQVFLISPEGVILAKNFEPETFETVYARAKGREK